MRLGRSFYPVPELIMNTSNHVGFISHSGHRRIVRNFNPLFVCLYFCCGLGSLTAWAAQEPKPLELIASGDRRQLSPGIFGASADPFYENLIGNAAKTAADAITAPATVRFPGGTQANYYDWTTGKIYVQVYASSSAYTQFWGELAPKIDAAFPNGISLEDYLPFAGAINADVILVPNLQTSTVSSQVAWFQRLANEEDLPNRIELGNEFYFAMNGDPNVEKQFPDVQTATAIMKQYETALRPYLSKDTKFAVQAAASDFYVQGKPDSAFAKRLVDWDRGLKPAMWFQAVTMHLYPDPTQLQQEPGGNTPDGLLKQLLGKYDSNTDQAITKLERKLPGKEIWITEWNPRGGGTGPDVVNVVTPAILTQAVTRMNLTTLKHASVAKSLYFMLDFSTAPWIAYVPSGDGYVPVPGTAILAWFNQAANAGGVYQSYTEKDIRPEPAGPGSPNSYREIEAASFDSGTSRTLLLQNATDQARPFEFKKFANGKTPQQIEVIATPDLASPQDQPVSITSLPTTDPVVIPPYSLTRFIW